MSSFATELTEQSVAHLAAGRSRVAVIGMGPAALEVSATLGALGGEVAIFDPRRASGHPQLSLWEELGAMAPELVVIASDPDKQELLLAAALVLDGQDPLPHVVLAGLAHQEVIDALFEELEAPALVRSYATGHPHTRVHLYQCLRWAAARGGEGAIVELGAFKGGTSVWLAKAAAALGLDNSPVIGFDAWDGFPRRRSLLDLYEHPRCVFRDLDAVRAYVEPHGVELVPGDITETAPARLAKESVLLAFVDTDNYSGARAALETIVPNLVNGGAIVLDHYFTTEDYAYTVGERVAAVETLSEAGLLNLHGTGVFLNVD